MVVVTQLVSTTIALRRHGGTETGGEVVTVYVRLFEMISVMIDSPRSVMFLEMHSDDAGRVHSSFLRSVSK